MNAQSRLLCLLMLLLCLFTHFKERGHRVALQNKTHVGPPATFPCERIGGIHKGEPITSWQADAANDPRLASRVEWLFHRPAEELYDLESDAYEMKNLGDDPKFADLKARLREQLDAWMTQQGDDGMETELKAKSRQGKGAEEQSQDKPKARSKAKNKAGKKSP